MTMEHPNKILAHEPMKPYPMVFKVVMGLLCFYLLIIFASTGSHFLVSGGAH